jgi:hypothetical protein
MAAKKCPGCGKEAELLSLDSGMKLRLKETGQHDLPESVCGDCYTRFTSTISQGAQLRAKAQAMSQHRMSLWRNRVSLLKQARQYMDSKAYSEAAVYYEKYLKILEIIYEIKPGGLTPEIFKNKARQKELTIITTVYWDLVRIYDTSAKYGDRLKRSIDKLILFAPNSTLMHQLVKNVATHAKSAKNPELFKDLHRQFGIKRRGCFIATAAFENQESPEVLLLQRFRDTWLDTSRLGKEFIEFYYSTSPAIADWMTRNPRSKKPIRTMLRVITFCLEKIL